MLLKIIAACVLSHLLAVYSYHEEKNRRLSVRA
jgi:hypothetical protein